MNKNNVNYVPEGRNSVTPYLIVKNAAKAIDYYKNVFGATELMRLPGPDGRSATPNCASATRS